jgi:hypothetical protein
MEWADSSQPRKLIHRALRNPALRRSFNSLGNVKRSTVYRTFNTWAKKRRMTAFTREALRKQLDIRRAGEFKRAITRCIAWLAKRLTTKYAMIVEITRTTAKSSTWLAGPVIEGLMTRYRIQGPSVIIPFVDGTYVSARGLKDALDAGITTFVHVDDAIYSGSQKGIMVRQLRAAVNKTSVKKARVLLAVPYTTDIGRQYIRRLAGPPLRLEFYAPYTIATRSLPWVSRVELLLRGDKNISAGGPAMTVLPHKMPNSVSFGPSSLSYMLQARIPKPVYKKISF